MNEFENLNSVGEEVTPSVEQNETGYRQNPDERSTGNFQSENNGFSHNVKKWVDPETAEEKSRIKTDARIIGAAFLAMYGMIFLFNLAVIIVAFILQSGSDSTAAEILWDPAVLQVQQIFFASAAFTLPFILIFKLGDLRISDLISFSLPDRRTFLPLFLIGVAFCNFANIASSIAESLFDKTDIDYQVTSPQNPTGIFGFALAFISTVIVPALAEEFACRGMMLGLLRKYGDAFAIMASSLLFGLMHGNFEQMPFAFLVGLVLGFVTVKSGSILPAMAIHAFNNFVSICFDYFLAKVPVYAQNIGYIVFLTAGLLLGIVAVFMFRDADGFYKLETSRMKAGDGKKFIWFFTSVPILIYAGLCVLESLQFFVF